MAELCVEERAFGFLRRVAGADRGADPGAGGVAAMLVGIGAFEDENLLAAAMVMQRIGFSGVPAKKVDALGAMLVQQHLVIGIGLARCPCRLARVEDDAPRVVGSELPQLDEEDAARGGIGRMARPRRIAQIGAGGIVAMLVGEDAVEDEDFLAAAMLVRGKAAAGREADKARRPRHLAAVALQHLALDAGLGRGGPGQRRGVDDRALEEIRVDPHRRTFALPAREEHSPAPGGLSMAARRNPDHAEGRTVIGRRCRPRITSESDHSSAASVSAKSPSRRSSVGKAISPSRRARWAPRQVWMPEPKASCRLAFARRMSSRSGSANTSGSRLAPAMKR